jgi:hypothetical protein
MCEGPLCVKCDQFLKEGSFSFYTVVPDELKHTHYCTVCYTTHVEPAFESYNALMEKAKGLYFFFVENCPDRDETILRLAFIAAEQGYSAVIEAEVTSKKVRYEGWQKMMWSGVATPVFVDIEKLERHEQARERF